MKTKARTQNNGQQPQAEQTAAPVPATAAHHLSDAEQADIRRLMQKVEREKIALADLHLMADERAQLVRQAAVALNARVEQVAEARGINLRQGQWKLDVDKMTLAPMG